MKAAFIALNGCELWEIALLQKALFENGWVWRTLTLDGKAALTDGGIRLAADSQLELVSPRDFQLVVLAGLKDPNPYLGQPSLQRFLRQFDGQNGWIAAAGSAVVLVADAGLLGGLQFTVDESVQRDFSDVFLYSTYTGQNVAVHGNILTCKARAFAEWTLLVCRYLNPGQDNPDALDTARKLM